MTKPMLRGLIILPLTAILAACSGGGEEEPTPVNPDNDAVTFKPVFKNESAATETEFENGDRISVFAVEGSSLAASGNFAHNIPHIYNGTNFVGEGSGIRKPSDKSLSYYAVYPYTSTAGPSFTFSVSSNQKSGRNYTLSDLCTAATAQTASDNVSLNFSHRLSNFVINLTCDRTLGGVSVKLNNMVSSVDCDMNALTFLPRDSRVDITCAENGTNSFRAIVVPQHVSKGTNFLTITVDGKDYELEAANDFSFESGRQNEYDVEIRNGQIVRFTGNIRPWNSETIEDVIPEEVLDKWGEYIDIHRGTTPPDVTGCYFLDPQETVYCEDQGNGGYDPGTLVYSLYIRLYDQDRRNNTISMQEMSSNQWSESEGNGAFIMGEGNDFTIFFDMEGTAENIYYRTATVISGTKTSAGIKDLKYAFVMTDKGDDPENKLMRVGVYRVFRDQDGLSVNATWPGRSSAPMTLGELKSHLANSIKL